MYKIYKAKRINSNEYVIGELSTAKIAGTTRQKYLLTPIGENNVYYEIKRDTLRISTNTTDRKGNLIFNRDKALYIDNGGKEHLCTIIGIATDDRVQYGAANEEEQELYMCLPSFGKCEQIELIEEDNCNYCTHTQIRKQTASLVAGATTLVARMTAQLKYTATQSEYTPR